MIINNVPLILTATCITALVEFLLLFFLLLAGNKRRIEERRKKRKKKCSCLGFHHLASFL
jgi:hypothetical protein